MPTIQDLELADLRVVRDDDGKITSIIDTAGRDVGLVSSKVDPLTGGIEESAGGVRIYGRSSKYQQEFERLLSVGGAVFNGTTDDGPGVQYALDNLAALNKKMRISIPAQGATMFLDSSNGTGADVAVKGAIVVKSRISLDLNDTTVSAGAGVDSDTYLVIVRGADVSSDPPRGNRTSVIENGSIISGYTTLAGALYVDGPSDAGAASHMTYRNLRIKGASSKGALVGYGSNVYLSSFDRCSFSCLTATAAVFNGPVNGGTNSGENIEFRGCLFSGSAAGSGSVIVANSSAAGIGYTFYACSFDYNNLRTLFKFVGQATAMRMQLYGCHIEDHQKSATPNPMVVMQAGATNAAFNMFGGEISLFSAGTGSAPAYLFDAGLTGAAAPKGITLDRVMRNIGSQVLANPSATGRFLDNQ